jgi:hypothetical protein
MLIICVSLDSFLEKFIVKKDTGFLIVPNGWLGDGKPIVKHWLTVA